MRVLLAILAAVAALPAAAAAAPRSIVQDDATLLRSGDLARERALDELWALGADTVRVLVVWRDYAPSPLRTRRPAFEATDPGAYPLGALDALAASARRRGLELLLTPTGPGPAWASPCRGLRVRERGTCRPDPREFGRFVRALGRRYPDQRSWAIWNEPNVGRWLIPQFTRRRGRERTASPAHYARLLRAAASALRATGHGRDELLIGETAPVGHATGDPVRRPMAPGLFIRRLLAGRARLPGTGFGHHAYTRGGSQPPRTRPLRDELAVSALGQLVALLDRGARRGVLPRRFPVHLTEGGWQTDPPDGLFGVSLAAQARYLNEVEWLVRRRPRVRSVAQYLLFDEPAPGSFQSGLRFAGGAPKPALPAYRLPIWVTRRGATVRVWGRVRPAGRAGGAETVTVERRRRGRWRALKTVAAREDVLVRLRSPRAAWRLRWGEATSRVAAEARR